MKPDKNAQFKRRNIFFDPDRDGGGTMLRDWDNCLNCNRENENDLEFGSPLTHKGSYTTGFCSVACASEWHAKQPLENWLFRRANRREREQS